MDGRMVEGRLSRRDGGAVVSWSSMCGGLSGIVLDDNLVWCPRNSPDFRN